MENYDDFTIRFIKFQGAERLIENNAKEDTPNSQRDENALFWKTLSVTLDRFSFIISLVISLINFLYFIPQLYRLYCNEQCKSI